MPSPAIATVVQPSATEALVWLTKAEVGRLAGVSTSTVERAIRGGGLRASRTSGRVLIQREWAEKWFEQLQSSARARVTPATLGLVAELTAVEGPVGPTTSPPPPLRGGLNGRSSPAEAWRTPPCLALEELYRRVGLHRRVHRSGVGLDAHELERWLVEQGLARTTRKGQLIPTALGLELGGSLNLDPRLAETGR